MHARNTWHGSSALLRSLTDMQKLCHMIKTPFFALTDKTTAVIFWDDSRGAVEGEVPAVRPVADFWRADLQASGVEVLDTVVQCSKLVHSVQHHAQDGMGSCATWRRPAKVCSTCLRPCLPTMSTACKC